MELGLSLGDHQSASNPFMFLPKIQHNMGSTNGIRVKNSDNICGLGLGICMGLGISNSSDDVTSQSKQQNDEDDHTSEGDEINGDDHKQLDLLPLLPAPHLPLINGTRSSGKRFNVNSLLQLGGGGEVTSASNSVASTRFPMDFDLFKGGDGGNLSSGGGREGKDEEDEEDETCMNAKKKLRLSKEQSAYLEESFKEHHTLNPKQKHALAKQLNLRPRQIEVWFQNRRARTKLKQTEVDCEYLKRCCETLTEENKRLHKELQELRVLKTSSTNPFYMQVPPTTLTMCSSCEKLPTSTTPSPTTTPAAAPIITTTTKAIPFPPSRSTTRPYPFSQKNN